MEISTQSTPSTVQSTVPAACLLGWYSYCKPLLAAAHPIVVGAITAAGGRQLKQKPRVAVALAAALALVERAARAARAARARSKLSKLHWAVCSAPGQYSAAATSTTSTTSTSITMYYSPYGVWQPPCLELKPKQNRSEAPLPTHTFQVAVFNNLERTHDVVVLYSVITPTNCLIAALPDPGGLASCSYNAQWQ